jgi:hypothetical protein
MNKRWLLGWAVGYAALAGVVVWSMLAARDRALEKFAAPRSVDQWQAWRADVEEQQTEPGPVVRRVPKSDEPPSLVLMRDHFAVSMSGAIVFSSVLYWVLAWLVTGILTSNK